jgi:hypothetical protein
MGDSIMVTGRYKVVIRLLNGQIKKGFVDDFWPSAKHILFKDRNGKEEDLQLKELKALFYVDRFEGNKKHSEAKQYPSREAMPSGVAVRIKFKDNEMIEGLASNTSMFSTGFFLTPADPDSNNKRIFVVKSALEEYVVIGLKNSF